MFLVWGKIKTFKTMIPKTKNNWTSQNLLPNELDRKIILMCLALVKSKIFTKIRPVKESPPHQTFSRYHNRWLFPSSPLIYGWKCSDKQMKSMLCSSRTYYVTLLPHFIFFKPFDDPYWFKLFEAIQKTTKVLFLYFTSPC